MEHVGQSIANQYYCTLKVLVRDRITRQRMDIILIGLKPLSILSNKSISLSNTLNSINFRQKGSELFTSLGFRISPQPTHSFSLEMVQAALNCHFRPDQSQSTHNGAFTIGSDKARVKPLFLEADKPGIGLLKGFLFNIYVSDNFLIYPIHQIQQAAILMKIGRIIKHVLYLGILKLFLRSLFKPIILNVVKSKGTITRKLAKPSN